MRKLILSACFVAAGSSVFAQKLDDVQKKIDQQKYAEARQDIDKILADPKNANNANAWYYKGLVYNQLSLDTNLRDMDYRMEAFNAYKKYQQMDAKNILMTLNQNAGLFQLYEGYYNRGIQQFNAKDYQGAFNQFRGALQVKDYIYGKKFEINNFTFPAIDTQLVNLAGNAAFLAKQEDAAMPYFQILADAKLRGPDYKDVYPIIVDYYGRKQDAANKAKYLAIGMELYPENIYWIQTQLDEAGDDKAKRMAKYQELLAKNTGNYDLATDYAAELFNYTYAAEKPSDYAKKQEELTTALKNAVAINPKAMQANFIMTQHLSNQLYDLQQSYAAVKGTKPEDIKKKQDINKTIEAKYEELYPYSLSAYNAYEADADKLKAADKANFRSVTNLLADYHRMKKQADKAKMYEDKAKTIR